MIFVFLCLTSLNMIISRSTHVAASDIISFFLFCCIHVPHLYLFLCWWTFRLLPCLGYCKHYCSEHRCMYLFELWFSADTCPGLELLNHKSFPGGSVGKESACNAGDAGKCEFYTWIGKILWRRVWQPTPVFLPGESHGQRSLAVYSPWGHTETRLKLLSTKESDTTEATERVPKHMVVLVY